MLSVALSLTPSKDEAAGRYPAPLFRGARTFLGEASFDAAARSPGRADIGEADRFFESASATLFFAVCASLRQPPDRASFPGSRRGVSRVADACSRWGRASMGGAAKRAENAQ